MMPVKDPHTGTQPLALASGHGRHTTATPDQALVSVGEWPLHIAVIICNHFTPPGSRSALKNPFELLESSRH